MTDNPKSATQLAEHAVSGVPVVQAQVATDPKALVQRLWEFCDVLRDDGLSYGDYLEQLTYLLFLKMADEHHEMLGGNEWCPSSTTGSRF